MSVAITTPADPYDRLAPAYDVLTAGYDHERWLAALRRAAGGAGLAGAQRARRRLRDRRERAPDARGGFAVTGVDRSAGMLAIARRGSGPRRELVRADMRGLPAAGGVRRRRLPGRRPQPPADAAPTCRRRWSRWRATSRPARRLLFDLNTLPTLRQAFSSDWATDRDDAVLVWRGTRLAGARPGGVTHAEISVLRPSAAAPTCASSVDVGERHHPMDEVLDRLWRAGLEPVAIHGQHRGGRLEPLTGEHRHHKLVFLATRPEGR